MRPGASPFPFRGTVEIRGSGGGGWGAGRRRGLSGFKAEVKAEGIVRLPPRRDPTPGWFLVHKGPPLLGEKPQGQWGRLSLHPSP